MASKRDQFLNACRNSKLDTVRWGLGAGGQTPGTRDDDGVTAIMLCALANKHKALQMLLDNCRRSRMKEPIDFVDGEGEGRTALMMAAARGHSESCDELLYAGANYKLKCAKGKTAADYARKGGHDALARKIDRGGDSSEEEEESEEEGEDDAAFEGETSTQRSKRKKKEMEALERRGEKPSAKVKNAGDDEEEIPAGKAPEARWPETAKAKETEAKELAIERNKGDTEVDPALFYIKSVNNLKLKLGDSLTKLSPDISRMTGLLTLIISGNGLVELPESIGKLKNLKVLEAENNDLVSLPASLAQCKNLEILRVSGNKIKSLAPLNDANNLVTLVVDNNKLTTLDDFTIEAKERLVTLSARMNKITDAPPDLHQCTLLAEIFLKSNKIEELPGEWGELKEKKVRAIELDDNPIADPKVKKMMGKSANFVKELLTYLRKNGKKSAGKKKKKPVKVDSEDEASDNEPAAPAAAPESNEAKASATKEEAEDESETEEELEARMAKMNKKEREKFKRKLAEERQAKAAKEAEQKRKAADAAAAARLQAAKTMHDDTPDDDDESDIDSDDEMALLARKKKKAGKGGGGFLYAMTDEQRAEAEKAEAERLLAIELKKQAEEDAKKAAEQKAALELAAKVNGVKLTGDGVYGWEYTGGQFKSTKVPALPKGAKGPCVELEIPKIIVGKIIGQKGTTIKGVQDRSKAMVSIDETKGGSGNSLLRVRGDENAMESARMLINNALAGKR
jgi:hypothetical protein